MQIQKDSIQFQTPLEFNLIIYRYLSMLIKFDGFLGLVTLQLDGITSVYKGKNLLCRILKYVVECLNMVLMKFIMPIE